VDWLFLFVAMMIVGGLGTMVLKGRNYDISIGVCLIGMLGTTGAFLLVVAKAVIA